MESRQPPPINGGLNQQYLPTGDIGETNNIPWLAR
jgi:hypothetical protein